MSGTAIKITNLTKVYKNEINTSFEFKQYKKAMVRAKTHRKRR